MFHRFASACAAAFLIIMLPNFPAAQNWMIRGREAPTEIVSRSPAPGEDDVSVTREAIIEFSDPIDPSTVSERSVAARFSGEEIAARRYVAKDQRTVTLFWDEQLPASAEIQILVDGGALLNTQGEPVDVTGDGSPGGEEAYTFQTLSLSQVPGTVVTGRVFASELKTVDMGTSQTTVNRPLAGVEIFVQGAPGINTVTDSSGNFRLENAPAGEFFVYIDGRAVGETNAGDPTSYPDGPYYPFVGKKWRSIPGSEFNIGDFYLPLVEQGALQEVSETEETKIEFVDSVVENFPEFEGTELTVPPDSLFSDNGLRGGMAGISPVPPDRIPGQLPPGLDFPLVITVQTDGASNFDEPAPVCFPNLPNPQTGEKLEPGDKTALWSFNHDIGEFEVIGSATISEDGELACTDPGVGIPAPGWHGVNPGSQMEGGGAGSPTEPECPFDDPSLCLDDDDDDDDDDEEEDDCKEEAALFASA